MRDRLRVGVVNFQAAWGDIPENLARIERICQKAKEQGAELVVFPEVAVSGYSIFEQGAMQKDAAEQIPGACSQTLCRIAKELGLYLAVGMPERDGQTGDIYNSLLAVSPMGVDAVYRKIHPFGHESLWCKRGQAPAIWQTPWGKIGLGICYDTYQFPELIRYYASQGCRLYLNSTAQAGSQATPEAAERFRQYYLSTIEAASLSNEIFIASSNLAGEEEGTQFGGASLVIGPVLREEGFGQDPYCRMYAGGLGNQEIGVVTAEIDLSLAVRTIYQNNPITGEPDYRPELYRKWQEKESRIEG